MYLNFEIIFIPQLVQAAIHIAARAGFPRTPRTNLRSDQKNLFSKLLNVAAAKLNLLSK